MIDGGFKKGELVLICAGTNVGKFMICHECTTKNVHVLPGFGTFSAPKVPCQTCIRLRLERLERLWALNDLWSAWNPLRPTEKL